MPMPPKLPPATPWSRPVPWVAAILLATFFAYAPTIHYDFSWDDRFAAMGDNGANAQPLVAELHPISDYFSHHYWPQLTEVGFTYRPFTTLTFAWRHALFGDNPMVAHLFNVLAHVLATWCVYLLMRSLAIGWRAAVAGTAVFGLHAIHSEAVASVVGRAEVLALTGGAIGFLLLLRARAATRSIGWLLRGLATLSFFLACCSKESAIVWVAFVPLCFTVRRFR